MIGDVAGGRGDDDLPAGQFSDWLGGMGQALRGEQDSDVACDGCTACCTSSQFVHIAPDETETLAHIPPELVFPAPARPAGHVLLGYDELGRCPMLADAGCSIYEHRPRTCRTYDCRIFPATGVVPDADQGAIAARAGRWRFTHTTGKDHVEHQAVRAAARFVEARARDLADTTLAATATQRAVLAVELHGAFVDRDAASGRASVRTPTIAEVRVVLNRRSRPAPSVGT